jgi:hypothetical protein
VPPEGVIVGGWKFVIAAFSITGGVFLLYAWSLYSRLASTKDHDHERPEA